MSQDCASTQYVQSFSLSVLPGLQGESRNVHRLEYNGRQRGHAGVCSDSRQGGPHMWMGPACTVVLLVGVVASATKLDISRTGMG
eukprot:803725-Pyramimonas_sp.AAC.1